VPLQLQGNGLCFADRGAMGAHSMACRGNILPKLILTILLAVAGASTGYADKRVALVIGNSAYRNVSRLDNPVNDAKLMAETLRGLGFTLIGNGAQVDLDKASFDSALETFGNQVQGADVGLFYYAGHGVQVGGRNFLVPVTANPTKLADVYLQMVDTAVVLSQMEGSGTRLNLVILDACRNNPFGGRGLRATTSGLAQMQAPEGTLISYATQPGNVAQDGTGGDSPYTKALAQTIKRPGLGIFEAFNEVGLAVKRDTGGAQQPWVSSSPIAGTFYFAGIPATPDAAGDSQRSTISARDPLNDVREDFATAEKFNTREVWEAFLEKYPSGLLATAAKARLSALPKTAALPPSVPAPADSIRTAPVSSEPNKPRPLAALAISKRLAGAVFLRKIREPDFSEDEYIKFDGGTTLRMEEHDLKTGKVTVSQQQLYAAPDNNKNHFGYSANLVEVSNDGKTLRGYTATITSHPGDVWVRQ
jgi:hypothetical protein